MKRSFELTFIILLASIAVTSGIPVSSGVIKPIRQTLSTFHDSINFKSLIEVDSFRLAILPPAAGVQFYRNQLVFLSASKNEKKMSPGQISFGTVEAYTAPIEDTTLGRHKIFSPSSSFTYPSEAMTFSSDYDTVYYSKIPKKGNREKIFRARFIKNNKGETSLLTDSIALDFCNDNYTYSHPALSPDGQMMIFSSDRVGSVGGMDLYISRRSGSKWSPPENLGKEINTSGNEFFSFLDAENNLYFSSDGLPGYGGYDIFTCKFNGSGWNKPINLSDRINSAIDDIAFTINKLDGKTAFFTRREISGKREMQLFRVTLNKEAADLNTPTLAFVFNGKPVIGENLLALVDTSGKKREPEQAIVKPSAGPVKKEAARVSEPVAGKKKISENKTAVRPVSKEKNAVVKSEITKPAAAPGKEKKTEEKSVETKPVITSPADKKSGLIYRVQILTSDKPGKYKEILLNGKTYSVFEYYYRGAYRSTIGEFRTLAPAAEMQKLCRKAGYPQAFVAAFVNNSRSNDPELFK
jgi:WD40-like Beta Propeller Repeat